MITLFARHTVSDYQTWRKAFDAFGPTLKAAGVVGSLVYQSVDDPNDLTVAHEFSSLEDAQAFASGDALRKARPDAGVAGTPTVWFTTRV